MRIEERFRGREVPAVQQSKLRSLWKLSPTLHPWSLVGQALTALVTGHQVRDLPEPAGRSDFGGEVLDSEMPIDVRPVSEMSQRFSDLTADLNIVLGLLTGLGVLIAIFSILNTMLMSVAERTVEFGILRANGWSRRDIVRLIASESALLGIAGGLLGVVAGWGGTHFVNAVWADRLHLYASPRLLVFSLLFSMLVGMAGGFYPALRAANLSPMDAIRRG